MFTSSAEVFRTRQAVRDLVEVVRSHRAAVERLAKGCVDLHAIEKTVLGHGKLPPDQPRLVSAVLFAAATPDEDFSAFTSATALLIGDRLQQGVCEDNLFWNWDAFRDHYRLADPPVRAALMNGYRAMHMIKKVTLDQPPCDQDCFTMGRDQVSSTLRSNNLDALHQALARNVSDRDAGKLWSVASRRGLSWPEKAAFRYLYERPESMAPDEPEDVALIPWV